MYDTIRYHMDNADLVGSRKSFDGCRINYGIIMLIPANP